MQTVTKADLAKILADDLDCKNTQAKQAVDVLFETLADAIIHGERIEIRGFGSWEVKKTNARPRARNPRTGAEVYVPARRKVRFKPGKILRNALSRPLEEQPGGGDQSPPPPQAPPTQI
ncbi:MAG: integration host factor subunit beta [bacterium]|nr:integration host factor subunit beta [bacterium]